MMQKLYITFCKSIILIIIFLFCHEDVPSKYILEDHRFDSVVPVRRENFN